VKGKIEVYKSFGCEDQELILEGNNTVVDGAGELLADIMTAHASLSSIPNLSSILDASNYTIQAMSFGTDSSGYRKHGHEWGTTVPNKVSNQSVASDQPTRIITISTQSDLTVSSYDPSFAGNILPSFVTPRQTKLEENTLPSGVGDGVYLSSLASGITDIGHNLNIIPYASSVSVSASLGGISSLGGVFGCYPEGSGTGGTQFYVVSSDANIPTLTAPLLVSSIYQGTYNGLFNQVSSMDVSGFLNFVGSSTTDVYLAAGFSGLTVSAETDPTIRASTTGEIAYKTVIGSGDLGTANLYGGIYNIGLWSMDLCAALENNNPPFAFTHTSNSKKYKLFSKKSLLANLCKTSDGVDDNSTTFPGYDNYQDLTIVWRLFFS